MTQATEQETAVPSGISMVDEVEILKHYTGDPGRRACHGRLRLGINKIPDKKTGGYFYQLQLCYCAKPIDSEYAKLEKLLMDQLSKQTKAVEAQTTALLQFAVMLQEQSRIHNESNLLLDKALTSIDRHTAGYWIAKVIHYFSMKPEHAELPVKLSPVKE